MLQNGNNWQKSCIKAAAKEIQTEASEFLLIGPYTMKHTVPESGTTNARTAPMQP